MGPVRFSDPSLRDSRSHGQARDPQPRNIRCGECIPPRECRMISSWLGSHGCGLCLKMATAVFAARVGTGVQPLHGENYTYSRVLDHVQLLIRPHFHRVVNPSILPPSSPHPPVESDEVQGEGVSSTDLGWVRDMIMDIYVYACIGNPSLSFGYFLYLCIHLKLAYRW